MININAIRITHKGRNLQNSTSKVAGEFTCAYLSGLGCAPGAQGLYNCSVKIIDDWRTLLDLHGRNAVESIECRGRQSRNCDIFRLSGHVIGTMLELLKQREVRCISCHNIAVASREDLFELRRAAFTDSVDSAEFLSRVLMTCILRKSINQPLAAPAERSLGTSSQRV